jgi:hypothetical protein
MNSKIVIEVPVLPRGKNPVGPIKRAIVVINRQPKVSAIEAMNEAFKTYVHPGVLQRAAQQTEE